MPEVPGPALAGQGRLMSLDALRGFDMFWIAGGETILNALARGLQSEWFNQHVIPQTRHVPWEGFTAWDLIMPLFLFVVGVAMPFSLARRVERGDSKARIYCHALLRVAILWVLGMIAQGRLLEYDLSRIRLYSNTLQAIAAGYLIATVLLLHLRTWAQVAVTVGLLLAYWGLLIWVPVPGHGAGQLTEQGNLAIYVDKLILGPCQDGTPYTWILSSMTFAATVMMGAFAGQLLRSRKGDRNKVLILAGAGLACVLAGWAWGQVFPIIKHIWTSSMVVFAGGWSLLLLAIFYLVIDVLGLRRLGLAFAVIGANAIFTYMAVHLFDFKSLSDPFVGGLAQWTGNWQDLVQTLAGVTVMWLILLFMYRRRIFIKI
jgi:predicted acyltransferase